MSKDGFRRRRTKVPARGRLGDHRSLFPGLYHSWVVGKWNRSFFQFIGGSVLIVPVLHLYNRRLAVWIIFVPAWPLVVLKVGRKLARRVPLALYSRADSTCSRVCIWFCRLQAVFLPLGSISREKDSRARAKVACRVDSRLAGGETKINTRAARREFTRQLTFVRVLLIFSLDSLLAEIKTTRSLMILKQKRQGILSPNSIIEEKAAKWPLERKDYNIDPA